MSAAPATTVALPDLRELHHRHHGLTPVTCAMFAEAAAVCLHRHHEPPASFTIAGATATPRDYNVSWSLPDPRALGAHANDDDATRDGAYSVGLAAIEATLDLVAVRRAPTLTGADWYLGASGAAIDLETAVRAEMRGVDGGDGPVLKAKLKEKLTQIKRGKDTRPGWACVVGFRARQVLLARGE